MFICLILSDIQYNLTPVYVGVVFFIGPVLYMAFSLPLGSISDKLVRICFFTFVYMCVSHVCVHACVCDYVRTPGIWSLLD